MNPVESPITLYGIITALTTVIVVLYRALQTERDARLNDLKDYKKESNEVFSKYSQQQELWFEKFQTKRA